MCWEGIKSDRQNDLTREPGRREGGEPGRREGGEPGGQGGEAEESANNHKEGPHYKK